MKTLHLMLNDLQEERERIEAMGGSVVFWGTWRVNGQLAVSRSIGNSFPMFYF